MAKGKGYASITQLYKAIEERMKKDQDYKDKMEQIVKPSDDFPPSPKIEPKPSEDLNCVNSLGETSEES